MPGEPRRDCRIAMDIDDVTARSLGASVDKDNAERSEKLRGVADHSKVEADIAAAKELAVKVPFSPSSQAPPTAPSNRPPLLITATAQLGGASTAPLGVCCGPQLARGSTITLACCSTLRGLSCSAGRHTVALSSLSLGAAMQPHSSCSHFSWIMHTHARFIHEYPQLAADGQAK